MSTSWPFDRNWPVISARRSQATQGWYSVRSSLPLRYSFVAIVNVATCLPLGQRPQLRVPGQPSDEQHLVHAMAPSISAAHRGRGRPLSGPEPSEVRLTVRLSARLPARAGPPARVEVVEAGRPQRELGHRGRLALELHPRHPSGDPLDERAVEAGARRIGPRTSAGRPGRRARGRGGRSCGRARPRRSGRATGRQTEACRGSPAARRARRRRRAAGSCRDRRSARGAAAMSPCRVPYPSSASVLFEVPMTSASNAAERS